ncbi:hypothetical protein PQR02_28240, partial [Paraburkholderia sediminicola]
CDWIERRDFPVAFLEERANPLDYFARAVGVLNNVFQYLAHFGQVDRIRCHKPLGGLSVAQNRGKGLGEFMRERHR